MAPKGTVTAKTGTNTGAVHIGAGRRVSPSGYISAGGSSDSDGDSGVESRGGVRGKSGAGGGTVAFAAMANGREFDSDGASGLSAFLLRFAGGTRTTSLRIFLHKSDVSWLWC